MARWLLKTDMPLYFPDQQLPKYTDEQLSQLVHDYLDDDTLRNEVVESQLRLTLSIASLYLSRYRQHPDEVVSDSMFALVRAITRFPKVNKDGNIGAFVNRTIWYSLKQAVLRNKLIPVPPSVLHRKVKDGTLLKSDIVSLLGDETAYTPINTVDENDTLEVILTSDEDRRILKMRVARYTGKEIADVLKVRVRYIWARCRDIRQKLELHLER